MQVSCVDLGAVGCRDRTAAAVAAAARGRRLGAEIGAEIIEDAGALVVADAQAEALHVVEHGVPGAAPDAGRIDHRLQVVAGLAVAVDEVAARPFRQVEPLGGGGGRRNDQRAAGKDRR